jgi:hypothetical protein
MLKSTRSVVLVLSCLGVLAPGALAKETKITDMAKHLEGSTAYKSADTLGKLTHLAKLIQEKKISAYDKVVKSESLLLVKAYMQEKGKDSVKARLEAYGELRKMANYKEPLYGVRISDHAVRSTFAKFLFESKEYAKASDTGKLEILRDLKRKNVPMLSTVGIGEVEIVAMRLITKATRDFPADQRPLKKLQALSQLNKERLFTWGSDYNAIEKLYLIQYLLTLEDYETKSSKEKMEVLSKMLKDKLITQFLFSELEAGFFVRDLLANEEFVKADDDAKRVIAKKFVDERKLHTYTRNQLRHWLWP